MQNSIPTANNIKYVNNLVSTDFARKTYDNAKEYKSITVWDIGFYHPDQSRPQYIVIQTKFLPTVSQKWVWFEYDINKRKEEQYQR